MALVSLLGYQFSSSAIQLAIQLGIISALPYFCQLVAESGLTSAFIAFLRHAVSGGFIFAIFRLQTCSFVFADNLQHGGAAYHASGRYFSYGPSSFVQLYALYSRTHLYLGYELAIFVIVVAATGSTGSRYGEFTWGLWLVSAALLASPFW